MLDRRGFFGWLAGIAGFGAVKEVQAVQTSKEARPLFVLTLEKDFSIEAVQRFRELWSKDHPDWDLVILSEGNSLEVHLPGRNLSQTIEQSGDYSIKITAPDLATYERLWELCVPKPHVVQSSFPPVDREMVARSRAALVQREGESFEDMLKRVQSEPACTPEESAEHLERLAKIREAWEKQYGNSINPVIPLEIHSR